jgi:hypothetical protein
VTGRRPLPAGAARERQLIVYMLAAPEWRARARSQVPSDLLHQPVLRELFEALTRPGSPDQGDALPDNVSPRAAEAWSRLRESASLLAERPLDDDYAGVVEYLHARQAYRAMKAIADPDEQRRRRVELDRRYPGFAAARQYYSR